MENVRGKGKVQHQKGQLVKRCLTFMLAVMVAFTSIPLNMAWADELPYSERPGSDEIILDDSVEEGDLSDIDLEISHTISKKGDKAVITVSAEPSETGLENGVTKVTKVEIHEDGRLKKGKRSDGKWEFTVKENGVYSFVIYYNSKDGEEIAVASPSEIEKVEPTTEAETQKPGGNAGGAGGTGTTQPGENQDQEVTIPETEDSKTDEPDGDKNTEDESKDNESVEGDSNQNTPNEPEQNPSDNAGADEKGEEKGDAEGNEGGTDSSEQPGSGDGSIDGSGNTDNGSGGNSGTADNNGDTGSDNNHDSSSGDDSSSGSADNSNTNSSGNSDTGSSDSEGSGSSDSSGSESDDSGSSDTDSSDNGGSDSDESIALNVIDFFFPVIEAQASDFTVKKAVIVEYEITNLFPEGDLEDIDVDIFDELTEEGAMITLLAEPSEIGLEKGVREITDITLIDYEPEDKSEIIDGGEISTATDSEAEFNEEEESVEKASPSEAAYNTSKSSSAKHAEYQDSECDEGEYKFFVRENGTYTFAIRYGRVTDLDFEDSTELVETQFTTTYELESIAPGVQFIGVEDVTIQAGQEFDLLAGVTAVSDDGIELPVVIQDNGGLNTAVPGTYKITYTVVARSILEDGNAERSVIVLPKSEQVLQIESDIHGTEEGKTLEVSPAGSEQGLLSVSYKLPDGVKGRVLKIAWPEGTTATYPTQSIVDQYSETINGIRYECLVINDGASGTLNFQIQYQIEYGRYAFDSYISSITSYEKAEEYLVANGKVNIGKIHVIADNDTEGDDTQSVEASIGDFITTKMEEGPVPQFVYKRYSSYYGRTPCNVTVNADLQASGAGASYSFNDSTFISIYFNKDFFSTEYKPWCIKTVRVYAPERFDFKVGEHYAKKGVITGEEADGYSYMDIPREFYSEDGLRGLFSSTKLVLREDAMVSRKTCTSKNTILTCVDYGGVEKKVETNPVVTAELYPYDIEEVNQFGIRGVISANYNEMVGGTSTTVHTYIENPVTVETSEEGVKHYKMPNRTKDIKVSITYPDDFWVNRWNFSEGTSSVSGHTEDKGSACSLNKLIIHLQDGKTVEYMVNKAAIKSGIYIEPGDVIPSNVHVDSVDFIFSNLYGVQTAIISYANTKEVNERRVVESTGAIDVDGTVITMDTCAVTLIPKPKLMTSLMASSSVSFSGKENRYANVSFYWDLGSNRKGTNCKIRVDDGTALQFFDGRILVPTDFQGGKIRYETSFGRTEESDIPYGKNEYIQFTTLEPEEQLTMVEIYKDGIINGGTIRYGSKVTYEELKVLAPDEEIAQLDISGSITMDEYATLMNRSATTKVYIYHGVQLGDASVSLSNDLTVYQGEKMKVMEPINISYRADYHFPGLYEPPFTAALDYAIYYKLGNPDNFLFMGLESDEFDAVLVTEENEKYIKITPKEAKEFSYKQGSSFREIRLDSSNLIFQAIPGATPGRQVVISDIYFTIDRVQQQLLNEQYRVKLGCDSAMASNDVPDWVNDQGLYMWDLNTKVEADILQQNLSAVNIIPGLGEIYKDSRVGFYPTERRNLNAMVSIGSGSDVLNQYNVRIPLPRNGKEITYSFNGEIRTAVSEYSVYLRDEIRYIDYGMNLQVRYRLTDNDMFIDSETVQGRWEDVEEIEIFIEKMPAKSTVVCYMDLEAEGKEGAGEKSAYIAVQSASEGGEIKYGDKAEFLYKDFTISGKAWIDNNENGKYESGEPYANNLNITLLQDGREADESNYYISMDTAKGNYSLNTCLYENLSMRFDGLDGNADSVKPTMTKADSNGSTSVFGRKGEWVVELPQSIAGDQSGYDLGIVKLPVLTANNTQVEYKSEVPADVVVTNQVNAPAVNQKIIYSAAADPSIASVSDTGLIKGLKESSVTTATASVKNSLGDEVTATYQIAVSDNKAPVLNVHPWTAIEGDTIPDWWVGIDVEKPEEEYPAWKTLLFGVSRAARSAPAENRSVTVYTNDDYTGEISTDGALNARGLYYVQYLIEDDKGNVVKKNTTLTVYGKIQGENTNKHYFETGETISVPKADFYYLDVSGEQVPVTEGIDTVGTDNWILNEGPLETVAQTAVHPQAGLVSDGVIAGAGREATANVSALVDSTINTDRKKWEITVIQYEPVVPERWGRTEGIYRHWKSESDWEGLRADLTVGADDVTAPGNEVETDTSVPGIYYTFRHAVVNEEYDNVDSHGQPLKNLLHEICKTIVVSKPVVKATDKIYVTPAQALNESFIKGKITATATYHDGTNPTAAIPDNQIKYVYNKTDGKITSVTITAWGGLEDNISDPAQVTVVIRETPVLTLPDIQLRKGTEYGQENFMDRVMVPEDENNEYHYVDNNLDTNNLGKYEAQYEVTDHLTGASGPQAQAIYVHGIPEITAMDKTLHTHQSTGAQALIDVVKLSAGATVEYTKADGTPEVKTIPADKLLYEVSADYVAGAAGKFKVTITADDTDYVPTGLGLEPVQVKKEVYVDVADQLLEVTFSTNSDERHDKGTIDGEAGSIMRPTFYGHTVAAPIPAANSGYHFDGFKTLNPMEATEALTLNDGTVIAAGSEIPAGTMLSLEQVETIEIKDNVEFQAYFTATPVLSGKNIKLYVGEEYKMTDLEITHTDLDNGGYVLAVDDHRVNTNKAGTYQVEVSIKDDDQNQAVKYLYVQVYGKTELEGADSIHIRSGQELSEELLAGKIKASYAAPPAIPDSPWNGYGAWKPAVQTEIPYDIAGTVDTQEIGLKKFTVSAAGQIEGREADGKAEAEKNLFVHGHVEVLSVDNVNLRLSEAGRGDVSDYTDTMWDILEKSNLYLSVKYVEADGTIRTHEGDLFHIANFYDGRFMDDSRQPFTAGTFDYRMRTGDHRALMPDGVDLERELIDIFIKVTVDSVFVKFSINNDGGYHNGDFEEGNFEVKIDALPSLTVRGTPIGSVPTPVAAEGYHFDGFKIMNEILAYKDIQLADGTIIPRREYVPAGSLIMPDQVKEIQVRNDIEFQACFSAAPIIKGENIILYEGEEYNRDKLHIEVSDLDMDANLPVIDDRHVNTDVAGTYQVKVTVNDAAGNQAEKYLYVQVVGKIKFDEIPDLHIRQGSPVTAEQLVAGVKAVYDKPEEIPVEPWPEANKVNNGHAAVTTAVEVHSYDVVNTDDIQKATIDISASGMIHGREMTGRSDAKRNIYIHGVPVVVVYDNGISTHESVDSTVLVQTVKNGTGTQKQDAASAYVEYVQADGSIQKVMIHPDEISYTVDQFIPLTAGDYIIHARVDDSSVLDQAQAPDLAFAEGGKEVKVVVADKMYTVNFEAGEHGMLENPADSVTVVAHGNKVTAPAVVPDEGYAFVGWLDEDGNKVVNIADIMIDKGRTFTAETKQKEFTVRFIGKNGNVLSTQIVKYGYDAKPPIDHPDVKDSRFTGWDSSYTNITKDKDIYATYKTSSGGSGGSGGSSGGGPSGGDRYVPSGPGNATTTIVDSGVPLNPFENPVTIGVTPVPTGNMDMPTFTGLPKTGDLSVGIKANVGYQATLIDGTRALSEDEPLVGHQNSSLTSVFGEHADWKKCMLHVILLILSALEGIFYFFKRRRDKRLLEELEKKIKEDK